MLTMARQPVEMVLEMFQMRRVSYSIFRVILAVPVLLEEIDVFGPKRLMLRQPPGVLHCSSQSSHSSVEGATSFHDGAIHAG